MRSPRSWGTGVWEEILGCQGWLGVLRRSGRWLRQRFQELEDFQQQVSADLLLEFGVLGAELVFNLVAGFSGGASCPSEVKVFIVLGDWGEAVLFLWLIRLSCRCSLVRQLVRLNPGFLSFPLLIFLFSLKELLHHHFHHLLWVEVRWCFSFLYGLSWSLVTLEPWWIPSSIPWAGRLRVSLSLSVGVSIGFPWALLSWVPRSLPLPFLRPCLVPWLIPVSSRRALTSTWSIPSVIPLFRSGSSVWVSFSVGRGCIPLPVWWLSAVLALGALQRQFLVLSVEIKNCWGFCALFWGHLLFAVGFLHQVSQLLNVHCSWACEDAKMVAYARMKVPQEESFKVQFLFHVRFVTSSKICLSESTVVSLRSVVTSLSRLQGSH